MKRKIDGSTRPGILTRRNYVFIAFYRHNKRQKMQMHAQWKDKSGFQIFISRDRYWTSKYLKQIRKDRSSDHIPSEEMRMEIKMHRHSRQVVHHSRDTMHARI
jgi:hypothetical protein